MKVNEKYIPYEDLDFFDLNNYDIVSLVACEHHPVYLVQNKTTFEKLIAKEILLSDSSLKKEET